MKGKSLGQAHTQIMSKRGVVQAVMGCVWGGYGKMQHMCCGAYASRADGACWCSMAAEKNCMGLSKNGVNPGVPRRPDVAEAAHVACAMACGGMDTGWAAGRRCEHCTWHGPWLWHGQWMQKLVLFAQF